ncbi:MAG: DUF2807 domain-containing protein [Muribaculaceae bacterium]|nr:DUF2807 domain-containing protein [Muribaculaceae bacterium]
MKLSKSIAAAALVGIMAFGVAVPLYALTNQDTVTRSIEVPEFESIDAEGVNVVVKIGPATGTMTVSGRADAVEALVSDVRKGELTLRNRLLDDDKNNGVRRNASKYLPTVTVTVSSLTSVEGSLASKITVDKAISASRFEAEAETAASITIPGLSVPGIVELKSETAGSIVIEYVDAATFKSDVETAGSVHIARLESQSAKIEAETAGKFKADTGKLASANLKADTAGNISMKGVKAQTGSAKANTGGSIDASITRGSKSTDTGGRVSI